MPIAPSAFGPFRSPLSLAAVPLAFPLAAVPLVPSASAIHFAPAFPGGPRFVETPFPYGRADRHLARGHAASITSRCGYAARALGVHVFNLTVGYDAFTVTVRVGSCFVGGTIQTCWFLFIAWCVCHGE